MLLRKGKEERRGDAHWHSSRVASLPCFLPSGQHSASRRCYIPGPGVLSADNKQADTQRPKLQRLAELEASRLSCVSLRRLVETGTLRLQREPLCVCPNVNATELVESAGGGGGRGLLKEGSEVLCWAASEGFNCRGQMFNAVSFPASYQTSLFSPLDHF